MQPQSPNDCEAALALNKAHLCTESFPGFVPVVLEVLFLTFFFFFFSAVVLCNFLNVLIQSYFLYQKEF